MSKLYQIVSDGFRAMTGQPVLRSIGGVPIINIRQDRRYTQEQMRVYAGPGGYLRSGPFAQNWTQETADMRITYRKALAEPSVKAALVGKVTNVCSLGLQMTPAVKNNPLAQEHADFCKHAITRSKTGFFGVGWEILWHGCMEGWSICEPKWKEENRGRFRGKMTLEEVKAKDTKFIMPILDPFLNITGLFNNHANYARMFDPSGFIIYSHLRMFGNPHGVSDLRAAYRAMIMIPDAIRMRMIFLDKYVGPFLASSISAPEMKVAMYNELKKSRQSGVLVYDKDSDVKVLDLATRGTADFQAGLQDLRQEVATGISGAFLHMMTGETPGARGDSQVQKDTVDLFVWMLAEQLAILINNTLIPWLMEMNYGAQYDLPIASLEAVSPADIVADLAIDEALDRMAIPTSVGEILERARRSPPRNGDPNDNTQLVKAKAQAAANPQLPVGAGNPPIPNGNGQSANPFLSQGALGFGELPNGHSLFIAPEAYIAQFAERGQLDHLSIESYAKFEGQVFDSFAETARFTGTKKDRLGREYYYVNGVRTSKEHLESGDPSKKFAKRAAASPQTRQAAIDHVTHHFQNPHELTATTMASMPHVMALMTVPQLKALKAQYGVKGGKRKDHYIELIKAKLAGKMDTAKPPAPTAEQLAAARPKDNRPVTFDFVGSKARAAKDNVLGNLSDDEIGKIAYAPPGAKITLSSTSENTIYLQVEHEGVTTSRGVYKLPDGSKVCSNKLFVIAKDSPHKGNGYRVFADQVATLKKAGVSRIETLGAGSGWMDGPEPPKEERRGMNGYYTWPRLGYGGRISIEQFRRLPAPIQHAMGTSRDIRKLFDEVPGGAKAWEQWGSSNDYTFDLSDNSPNMKALNTYVARREGNQNVKAAA